jgi:hypothetical protein
LEYVDGESDWRARESPAKLRREVRFVGRPGAGEDFR